MSRISLICLWVASIIVRHRCSAAAGDPLVNANPKYDPDTCRMVKPGTGSAKVACDGSEDAGLCELGVIVAGGATPPDNTCDGPDPNVPTFPEDGCYLRHFTGQDCTYSTNEPPLVTTEKTCSLLDEGVKTKCEIDEGDRGCSLRLTSGRPCDKPITNVNNLLSCIYRYAKSIDQSKIGQYPLYFESCAGEAPLAAVLPGFDATTCTLVKLDANGQYMVDLDDNTRNLPCNGMEMDRTSECKLGSLEIATATTCPNGAFDEEGCWLRHYTGQDCSYSTASNGQSDENLPKAGTEHICSLRDQSATTECQLQEEDMGCSLRYPSGRPCTETEAAIQANKCVPHRPEQTNGRTRFVVCIDEPAFAGCYFRDQRRRPCDSDTPNECSLKDTNGDLCDALTYCIYRRAPSMQPCSPGQGDTTCRPMDIDGVECTIATGCWPRKTTGEECNLSDALGPNGGKANADAVCALRRAPATANGPFLNCFANGLDTGCFHRTSKGRPCEKGAFGETADCVARDVYENDIVNPNPYVTGCDQLAALAKRPNECIYRSKDGSKRPCDDNEMQAKNQLCSLQTIDSDCRQENVTPGCFRRRRNLMACTKGLAGSTCITRNEQGTSCNAVEPGCIYRQAYFLTKNNNNDVSSTLMPCTPNNNNPKCQPSDPQGNACGNAIIERSQCIYRLPTMAPCRPSTDDCQLRLPLEANGKEDMSQTGKCQQTHPNTCSMRDESGRNCVIGQTGLLGACQPRQPVNDGSFFADCSIETGCFYRTPWLGPCTTSTAKDVLPPKINQAPQAVFKANCQARNANGAKCDIGASGCWLRTEARRDCTIREYDPQGPPGKGCQPRSNILNDNPIATCQLVPPNMCVLRDERLAPCTSLGGLCQLRDEFGTDCSLTLEGGCRLRTNRLAPCNQVGAAEQCQFRLPNGQQCNPTTIPGCYFRDTTDLSDCDPTIVGRVRCQMKDQRGIDCTIPATNPVCRMRNNGMRNCIVGSPNCEYKNNVGDQCPAMDMLAACRSPFDGDMIPCNRPGSGNCAYRYWDGSSVQSCQKTQTIYDVCGPGGRLYGNSLRSCTAAAPCPGSSRCVYNQALIQSTTVGICCVY